MICPVCGYENLQGEDNCLNCGADLRASDTPYPSSTLEERLVSAPLRGLEPPEPITVTADTTAADAVRTMTEHEIGCVLVTDDERLVGIFTERDALRKLAGRALDGITVRDVMTVDPVVLREEDSVAVAIHKMAIGGFRHIPLVEDGRATGIVSARDLFRYILEVMR